MKEFSPYKITWVEFFPVRGIVTKHDRKIFGDVLLLGRAETYRKHFPSREKAIEYLSNFQTKLDKQYRCLLFTDKQYSMASEIDGYKIAYTKKQLNEPYYI